MTEKELREQAWNFFQMQASQRLTTFNFYIAISSLLSTGLATSLKADICPSYLGIIFGFLLFLFSVIFWKLDQRNRDLIKGAENSLKYFESTSSLKDNKNIPHIAKRFTFEDYDFNEKKKYNSWRFWRNHYSYSFCFNAVFMIFVLVGLTGIIVYLVKLI